MLKTVCFTGHRPQSMAFGFNENAPECIAIKEKLYAQILQLIEQGADTFLNGMALGVDTWAAEAVLRAKKSNPHIRLIAAIPCPTQAKKWTASSVLRYQNILSQCDEIVTVSPVYFNGCMHMRNRYMVDRSDVLVAVYNGNAHGGTAATVHYALHKNIRIINILPLE